MARLRLLLRPWERTAAAILNVFPLPGLGALLAGWRNAHTTLRRNGALQMVLVLLGSWPLIVPGIVGLAWAIWDTVRIARADLRDPPPRAEPAAPDATPTRPGQAAPPKAARR
ncbi:MAG TPA: hypothetical protein VM327_10690 [Candidatus Thermoplasmatota archaeon]|nr:hypothetical protein [Candidatus Thermoplasmatota archaeon]